MDFGKVASIEGIGFSHSEIKLNVNNVIFEPSEVTILGKLCTGCVVLILRKRYFYITCGE